MGFNISGIALDATYEDKLDDLQNDLNLTLEYDQDVSFETASANWTDEGVAFVYFGNNSTLLFLNTDLCIEPYTVPGRKTLSFALSETSMAFSLNYCEGDLVVRSIMEHEDRKMTNEGTPFPFEAECGDASEIIWRKLDDVLGMSYHSIDLGAQAKKYKVSYGKPAPKNITPQSSEEPKPSTQDQQKEYEAKYKSFTNDQLYAEFMQIAKIPDARLKIECLIQVAALMAVGKERGIDITKPNAESKSKSGCAKMLVLGLVVVAGIISYALF